MSFHSFFLQTGNENPRDQVKRRRKQHAGTMGGNFKMRAAPHETSREREKQNCPGKRSGQKVKSKDRKGKRSPFQCSLLWAKGMSLIEHAGGGVWTEVSDRRRLGSFTASPRGTLYTCFSRNGLLYVTVDDTAASWECAHIRMVC